MKIYNFIKKAFLSIFLSVNIFLMSFRSLVFATAIPDEPMRLERIEEIFVHALIAIWSLSIPYFMFVVGSIGFQWMLSAGDEQKQASLKTRGGNVFISFALVFGGYIAVRLLISLLALRSPAGEKCFTSPFGDLAIFQFFFPDVCESSSP